MIAVYDLLVVSPHLDDGALSCGGAIHQATIAGGRVLQLTLFTGDPPAGDLSPLAEEILGHMNLDPETAVAHRRAEDLATTEHLGAEIEHWPLCEAIFRSEPLSGAPHYPTRKSLFSRVHPDDEPLVDDIAERLRRLPRAERVLVPLAIGGHVDHRLARRAAEAAFGDRAEFFEDFPYVRRPLALRRAQGWRGRWTAETIVLEPSDLDAKIHAIAAYRSQISGLFGNRQVMAQQVRSHAARHGGERVWRRVPHGT